MAAADEMTGTRLAEAAALMKALGNESRLFLLCNLHDGEKTVSALEELLDISQSAISQHLGRLRRQGLVKYRKDGLQSFYSLASTEVESVIGLLHDMYCSDG